MVTGSAHHNTKYLRNAGNDIGWRLVWYPGTLLDLNDRNIAVRRTWGESPPIHYVTSMYAQCSMNQTGPQQKKIFSENDCRNNAAVRQPRLDVAGILVWERNPLRCHLAAIRHPSWIEGNYLYCS